MVFSVLYFFIISIAKRPMAGWKYVCSASIMHLKLITLFIIRLFHCIVYYTYLTGLDESVFYWHVLILNLMLCRTNANAMVALKKCPSISRIFALKIKMNHSHTTLDALVFLPTYLLTLVRYFITTKAYLVNSDSALPTYLEVSPFYSGSA